MPEGITLGVAQCSAEPGETQGNLARCLELLREAGRAGCSLVAFPECCITGYLAASEREAREIAVALSDPWLDTVRDECRANGVRCVVGLVERARNELYNTAVLVSGDGIEALYRKIHLPQFGVDRFVHPGDRTVVVETPVARIGFAVCYDLRFPELCRLVALQGADIIVHITNFSASAGEHMDFTLRARAAENHVYVMSANCHGRVRGFMFSGRSAIVDPDGSCLARAPASGDALVTAQADLRKARNTRVVLAPGEHEFDLLRDRRPALYRPLASDHGSPLHLREDQGVALGRP